MKPYHSYRSRPRPPWWPENEPWPPHMRSPRPGFIRRIGCLFVAFNLFSAVLLAAIFLLVARGLGWVSFPFNSGKGFLPAGVFLIPIVIFLLILSGIEIPADAGPVGRPP